MEVSMPSTSHRPGHALGKLIVVLAILTAILAWWFWPNPRKEARRLAKSIQAVVAEASTIEEKVNTTHVELVSAVNSATVRLQTAKDKNQPDGMSPSELLVIVKGLVADGEQILSLHEKLLSISDQSIKVSTALKPLVVRAAQRHRRLAASESYADIRADFESAAAYFDQLLLYAETYPSKMTTKRELLAGQVPYIEHALRFLRQFQSDLEDVEHLSGAWLSDDVLARIGEFVKRYEGLRDALRGLKADIPSIPHEV
jgi:hypothetical protein